MEPSIHGTKGDIPQSEIKQIWLVGKSTKSFTIVNSYVCIRHQQSLEILFQIVEILQGNPKDLAIIQDEQK